MNGEQRQCINAQRRRDINRPLDYVKLWLDAMGGMLDVSAKQCQDCIGIFKYLAEHPQLGNFIPDAAGWGKEKCMRTLGIRGKIAADSPLFCRENGGIRCTAYPVSEAAQVLEIRATNRDNAQARWGNKLHATACATAYAEEEEERDQEEEQKLPSIPEGGYREPAPESGGGEVFGDGWLGEVMNHLDTSTPTPAPAQPHATTPAPSAADESMDPPAALALLKSATSPARAASPRMNRPDNFQQVLDAFSAFMPDADHDRVKQCAFGFWDAQDIAGWVDEQGKPLINWMNRARRYAEACIVEDAQADEWVQGCMQRRFGNNEAQ